MSLLQKVRNAMLGAEYDEDEVYVEDYAEEEEYEEESPRPIKESSKSRAREQRELRAATRKKNESNIVNLPVASNQDREKIVIASPKTVNDATTICEYLKNDIACVVDLNGVDKGNAQRIADFLGGAAFTLGGDMQRISNEIFLVVPNNVDITNEMKQDLKESGIILPWIQAAFK